MSDFLAGAFGSRSEVRLTGAAVETLHASGKEGTPKELVDLARPKSSRFHKLFEWDDAIAGERHRIEHARELIRRVQIMVMKAPGEMQRSRAFIHVVQPSGTGCYRPVVEVMSSAEGRAQALAEVAKQLAALKKSYRNIAELVEFFEEAEARLATLSKRRVASR